MKAFYVGMIHNDYGYLSLMTLGSFHLQSCTMFPYYQRLMSSWVGRCFLDSVLFKDQVATLAKKAFVHIHLECHLSLLQTRKSSRKPLMPYLSDKWTVTTHTIYELPIKNHLEAIGGPECSIPQLFHELHRLSVIVSNLLIVPALNSFVCCAKDKFGQLWNN